MWVNPNVGVMYFSSAHSGSGKFFDMAYRSMTALDVFDCRRCPYAYVTLPVVARREANAARCAPRTHAVGANPNSSEPRNIFQKSLFVTLILRGRAALGAIADAIAASSFSLSPGFLQHFTNTRSMSSEDRALRIAASSFDGSPFAWSNLLAAP